MGTGPLGLGEVNTRPIGMARFEALGEVSYTFDPKAIVLTYDTALWAANQRTVFEIRYVDDQPLQGDYSLYFHVIVVPGG